MSTKIRFRRPRRRKQQTVTKKIMNDVRNLKRKVNAAIEIRQSTTQELTTAMTTTPNVNYIIPIGTGDKTVLKWMTLRGFIRQNTDSTVADTYRVDVVLDRQPAGVVLDATDVYGEALPELGEPLVQEVSSRYKILRSVIGGFDEAEHGRSIAMIDFRVPLNLVATSNTQDTFTQAVINKNAVYVIYWTTSAANTPNVALTANIYTQDSQ